MIDRLASSGAPAPMQVEKPRQSGRGFADWLEREPRPAGGGDGALRDVPVAPNVPEQIAPPSAELATDHAASLIAAQDAGFPDVQMQLRGMEGDLETISLPWKLSANGSLSQWLLEHAGAGLDVGGGGLDAVAGAANTARQASASGSSAWSAQPEQNWRQANAPGGFVPQHVLAAADIDSVDASSPTTTRTQTAMPWLLRLFRWLEQKGHDPAIWLRDYRLDRADAHQLAEALRTHASEQGIRLERIVVNGHELWRAPSALPKESIDAR
jgi:hypothetical protein